MNAARVLAQRDANYHLDNSSRALNADFLEVIYRMAAGELPELDDFFVDRRPGRVLARPRRAEAVARGGGLVAGAPASRPVAARLHPLAVPRGFMRPGAAPPGATVTLHARAGPPAAGARRGRRAAAGSSCASHAVRIRLERRRSSRRRQPLAARRRRRRPETRETELSAVGHGAHGASVLRASADGAVVLKRDPRGGLALSGFAVREPIWHGPVSHASTSLGAASEDFLTARIEGNAGIAMTSSGEGGPHPALLRRAT